MLRDVRESDLPILFEHQWAPEAHRMAAFPPRERDAFMLHWRTKVLSNPSGLAKAIVLDEQVVGNICSWNQGGERRVGYWIGPEYWGRGIATAALLEFSREDLSRPLWAYVAARNRASMRVLEKCGFRQAVPIEMHSDGVEEYRFQLQA
jgi:RimJ/RimL family protein N-acetyltransferase